MENNLAEFGKTFLELLSQKKELVVITMTDVKGSAPQNLGARMILQDGEIAYGTVGGGKVEAHCIAFAKEFLNDKHGAKVSSQTWNLQRDIKMTCGGEASFMFEKYNTASDWNIVIFGAGHVSQALTRLLLTLDCRLTVIDNREEWLSKLPDDEKLTKIHSLEMENYISEIPADAFVVLMTMGHGTDVPILEKALKNKTFTYLGVIGSDSKRNRMEQELQKREVSKARCKEFICPIGEKIGTNTPGEIAISIGAQLLKYRDYNL